MKILALTTQIVYPPTDGGKQCVFYRLLALSQYEKTYLISLNAGATAVDIHDEGLAWLSDFHVIPQLILPSSQLSRLQKVIALGKWLFSGKPRQALVAHSEAYRHRIMRYISEQKIDTVMLEGPYSAELVDSKALRANGTKVVLVCHNVESLYAQDTLTWPAVLRILEIKRIRAYEQQAIANVSKAIAISPYDADYFRYVYHAGNVEYLPSLLQESQGQWQLDTNAEYACFCSNLSFGPNIEGLKWFIEEVFLEFIKKHKKFKLVITGKPAPEIRQFLAACDNVELTGFLPQDELYQTMEHSAFTVIPVFRGSGVKIKLLEAMSFGLPIITTPHCYDGVRYNKDELEPFIVAKNKTEFLQSMERFFEDVKLRQRFSNNARDFYHRFYCGSEATRKWVQALQ